MATGDLSVLRSPIQIGVTGFMQLLQSYHVGTDEVKQALVHHCDFIMECKVCRSLFRGLPNFLAHKRHYCEDPNCNVEVSLENVRIVQSSSTLVGSASNAYTDGTKEEDGSSQSIFFKSLINDSSDSATTTSPVKNDPDVQEGTAPIPCQGICGFTSFLIHHNLIDKSGQVCSLCKFKTAYAKRMRCHMHTDHLKKSYFFQCSHCLKVYSTQTTLQSHLVLAHNIASSEASRSASSKKTKVEKFVINGKVYNPPLCKPQGEFKDVSRQIVLKIFNTLGILNFTDREQYRAKCRLHPNENLDGFQNIRRHLVDFHLKSNNVCMFCVHSNSSFGHLVKHMVLSHDLTIDKIDGMKEEIKLHFSNEVTKQATALEEDEDERSSHTDESQASDDQSEDHSKYVHKNKANNPEKSDSLLKRKQSGVKQNNSSEPVGKRRKIEFDLRSPVKPVPASGTRTWLTFLRRNQFFLPNGKCRYCNSVLKSRRSQGKHLLNKHMRKQMLYQCKKCSLVFQQEFAFKSHAVSYHSIVVDTPSDFEVEKFVLQNGRVFDIPARLETAPVDIQATPATKNIHCPVENTDSSGISSTVLYSEREMLLAIITCMYIIKFKVTSSQMAQCVHHSDVALPSFVHVIEHLVSNHIKDDYTCFMCPFRRKDASSLVKHMAVCHHMSVDRIQRLREKIKSNFNVAKLTDSRKVNFASICLKATDQIIGILNSSRDGHRSDDGSMLTDSSVLETLHMNAEVKPSKCFFSSKDLVLALIDCLGVLKYHARPKTYQPNSKYLAMCLLHPSCQLDSLPKIISHLTDHHLKVAYRCSLCGVPTHSLEFLAEHLIRLHGLNVKKIAGMREAIRFSLLREHESLDNGPEPSPASAKAAPSSVTLPRSVRGIPCPRCGKKFTTFKRIAKHLKESHLVRPTLVGRLVKKLHMRMQRKDQKSKHMGAVAMNERVQTKSGRIIRKMSSDIHSDGDTAKDSMFGLEDIKCTICGRSYPTTSSAMGHVTKVHKMTTGEGRQYISHPVLSLKSLSNHHDTDSTTSDDNSTRDKRLRRSTVKIEDSDQVSVSLFGVEDLPCKICMKSFPKRGGLVDHYMRHHSITRNEVYNMLQAQKNIGNPKSQVGQSSVENKRKQQTPKRCELSATTTDLCSVQSRNSEESKSETICDKTATVKHKDVEAVDSTSNTSSSSFQKDLTKMANDNEVESSQELVNDDIEIKIEEVDSDSKASSNQSATSSLGDGITVPAASSNQPQKHPTKGLYRCIQCCRFFAGGDGLIDSEQPQCKKCRKPMANRT
ncbi:hypothetical protein LSH36_926g00052 [Paralvinella palmiformis]|uniref:C2H2-type domain-containing protein n=1 Tax=Paralvinella palmiformis TaxID=53620 RepID=A0AAD9IXA4_9ANNE|nr:hypothetical protein LSH36_926g00052 [Paralvinella palmiformis]